MSAIAQSVNPLKCFAEPTLILWLRLDDFSIHENSALAQDEAEDSEAKNTHVMTQLSIFIVFPKIQF